MNDRDWASTLTTLNGGAKCKPLCGNVDNPNYTGSQRLTDAPLWNDCVWDINSLRKVV